jgi:hypothetical protein
MANGNYTCSRPCGDFSQAAFCSPPKENNMYHGYTESEEAIKARWERMKKRAEQAEQQAGGENTTTLKTQGEA